MSSSTTSSSTANIVSLAEGEAATSLVLQDDVISVLGIEGDKLFTGADVGNECVWPAANESVACADDDQVPNQDEPSASKCNATDVWTSQCFGFEHEDQDYCSSASVDTWIVNNC